MKKILLFFLLFYCPVVFANVQNDAYIVFLKKHQIETYVVHKNQHSKDGDWQALPSVDLKNKFYLGSLWKVFLFAYLSELQEKTGPYFCKGHDVKHGYCSLAAGHGVVSLNTALLKSCELAFQHYKKQIDVSDWQAFWTHKIKTTDLKIDFILDVFQKGPHVKINPVEVLQAFQIIQTKFSSWPKLKKILAQNSYDGTAQYLAKFYPNDHISIKTFTMGDLKNGYQGGFAGWLDDATLFWVGGFEKSSQMLTDWYQLLLQKKQPHLHHKADNNAITVCTNFLEDYPITRVTKKNGDAVRLGYLFGDFGLVTQNNTRVDFTSAGDLILKKEKNHFMLSGCFVLNDYVARVLQKEGDTLLPEAKKALAILIRTYVLQNAQKKSATVFFLPDSTRWQRVSVNRSTVENQKYAGETSGLILKNGPVFYHANQSKSQTMNLELAQQMAVSGLSFSEILKSFFPSDTISTHSQKQSLPCQENLIAKQWLLFNKINWQHDLQKFAVDQNKLVKICEQKLSPPFYFSGHIYLNQFLTTEDQITLVHEWLHAIFEDTVFDHDEKLIEQLAQKFVLGKGLQSH